MWDRLGVILGKYQLIFSTDFKLLYTILSDYRRLWEIFDGLTHVRPISSVFSSHFWDSLCHLEQISRHFGQLFNDFTKFLTHSRSCLDNSKWFFDKDPQTWMNLNEFGQILRYFKWISSNVIQICHYFWPF